MAWPSGWYIDEDLLDVYRVMKSARREQDDVHGPVCRCEVCPVRATGDHVWLPLLAGQNWAIVTHDGFLRPGERQAIVDHRLGVYRLRWRRSLLSWDRITLAFSRWDEMAEHWGSSERPFLCRVRRVGPIECIDLT